MKNRKRNTWALQLVVVSIFVFVLLLIYPSVAYVYALSLEKSWNRADPQTKMELEQHLSLYSTRIIQPSQSEWGRNYVLAQNERMLQYRILWNAELDVVYDDTDRIIEIYTSYE